MIKIFVKGIANPSKKLGSYAFIAIKNGVKIAENSEWYTNTTCNRMELQAILSALRAIGSETDKIIIVSENNYSKVIFVSDTDGYSNIDLLDEISILIKNRRVEISRHSWYIEDEAMKECKLKAKEMMYVVEKTYSNFDKYLRAKVTIS